MVLESLVVDILNKILGDYIENLDSKQLKIGIWSGDVVLNSLKLRENALDDLDLPVQLVYGYLGKLVLKIPWKNLYSQPVVAEVEDFYLLVAPKEAVPYDAEKVAKYELQAKKAALQTLEDAYKRELDKDRPKPDATFTEKLTAQIINNLQVQIQNVHIRYEDTSSAGRPFAFGASLHYLELYTTDNNWQKCYLTEQVSRVFKVANLECLSVYMNCVETRLFIHHADKDEFNEFFKNNIATKEILPERYTYVFGPISSVAKLKLNMTPEYDDPPFKIPKIDLSLEMHVLHVGLTSTQFQALIKLGDGMNRMKLGAPYLKYRPFNKSYRGNYKLWWNFAIRSVLEEQVRKRTREYTWQHIKEHREMCRLYAEKFKEWALTLKPSATLTASIDMLEDKLDLFNLILIRKRMHVEVDIIKKEEEERKKNTAKSGWFSGWFGYGAQQNENSAGSYAQRLEAAMNADEKAKLYKAIGYSENTVPLDLPESYESIKAHFKLTALKVGLYDDSMFNEITNETRSSYAYDALQNIMLLEFSLATCDIRQRPSANALSATIGMKELKLTGITNADAAVPTLIESQITEDDNLLDIFFETNPLDKKCDQRVKIRARPLQVIYHASTVLRLIELFTPPKNVNLSELEGAATMHMANFKERSATGMAYMVESHSRIEVDIQFMPNVIIVPYRGVYEAGNCSVVVLTLGQVLLLSRPHNIDKSLQILRDAGVGSSEILETTMKMTYDTYEISIVDMQIVVARPKENWKSILASGKESDMHVLRPTTIMVSVGLCIIDDDPRLPKTKVEIEFPSIKINLTENRIFEAINVLNSLPMPNSEEPPQPPLVRATSSASSMLSVATFLGSLDKRRKKKQRSSETLEIEIIQYTMLDVNFTLKEFVLDLFHATTPTPIQQQQQAIKDPIEQSPQTESTRFGTPTDNSPTSPVITEQFEDTTSQLVEVDDASPISNDSATTERLLKFRIVQVEATFTQKTYEMNASAKLGAIHLKQYDSYEGKETELDVISTEHFIEKANNDNNDENNDENNDQITTQSKKDEYLFTAIYLNAQKTAPEFTTKYNSTEQYIMLTFSSLNLTLHQECLQRLLEIADKLQRKLERATESLQKTAQSKDRVGNAGDDSILGKLTTIAELSTIGEVDEDDGDDDDIHDDDNNPLPLTSEQAVKSRRKKTRKTLVESIKIHLVAKLHHVGVHMTCRKRPIASLDISHFHASVIIKSSYTELNMILKDILVTDQNPLSVHTHILSIMGKNALDCHLIMYNLEETSDYNSNDMKITVEIGCIKIVFLNWFVTAVLSFLNNFQAAQQALKDASAAAAETARQNALSAYERASRIKFDIRIKAPIIIVPQSSKSLKAIALDLGSITLANVINEIELENAPQSPAVLDELVLDLKDMKLMKVNLVEDDETSAIQIRTSMDTVDLVYGVNSDINMFDQISMSLFVKRNLSSAWYRDIPEIDISGRLKTIEINLFQEDYALLMSILEGNLNEGADEFPQAENVVQPPIPTARPISPTGNSTDATAVAKIAKESKEMAKEKALKSNIPQPKIYEQMKFNFQFDGIVVNFRGELDDLARFGLYFVAVKGSKLIDGTLSASVVLCNLQIDDMREKSKGKLTNYLCRKDWLLKNIADTKSHEEVVDQCYNEKNFMIDVTAIISENDTFAEVRVCGFDLILSVDFLLQISSFISVPPSETAQPSIAAVPQAASKVESPKRKPSTVCLASEEEVVEKKVILALHIDEPDIILVESVEDINCNAIIFNMQAHLNYRSIGERQTVNGQIDSLKMYMCSFMPEKRDATKHYIIHPCVISIQGSTPDEKGLHVSVKFSEIIINVSPATIELFNKALQTFQTGNGETALTNESDLPTYRDIWQPKKFKDDDYWFLKADQAIDALAYVDIKNPDESCEIKKSECCVLEIPSIALVVESGVGYYTTPLILIDTRLNAVASDWSHNLSLKGSLTLSMNYYNLAMGEWEPIIELNEHLTIDDEREFLPWELNFSVAMEKKQNEISGEEEQTMNIKVQSDENMELTLSKTCLGLLSDIGEAFSQAIDSKGLIKPEVIAPYVVENDTGFDISINFERGFFSIHECHMPQSSPNNLNNWLVFKSDSEQEEINPKSVKNCTISAGGHVYLQTKDLCDIQNEEDAEYNIFVKIGDINKEIQLPVQKTDKRYFALFRGANQDPWGIVSEVRTDFGTTKVNIHGVVNIFNHFAISANIYRMNPKTNQPVLIGEVPPHTVFHVPLHAIYADNKEIHFSLSGYKTSVQGFKWNDSPTDLEYARQLQCDPIHTYESLYLSAIRTKTEIYYENTNKYKLLSAYYTIHLKPPMYLRNALPIGIIVSVAGCSVREQEDAIDGRRKTEMSMLNQKEDILDYGEKEVEPGDVLHLPTVKLASTRKESVSYLVVRLLQYLEKDWSCTTEISEEHENIEIWKFKSYDSAVPMDMNLYVLFENRQGSLQLTLYSPFWMINNTGLMLSYRTDNENVDVLYHPPEYTGPILLSFREKIFFDKKCAVIRVDNGAWSEKIPLDVAGSIGSVTCKANDQSYQIGVHNHLTNNSLTKHISFIPFFIVTNKCDFNIDLQELSRPGDPWTEIASNTCQPIWPKDDSDHMIIVKVHGQVTMPFKYSEAQCVLLQLEHNSYGGINVDVQATEGGVYIVFTHYYPGDAPGLIINHTPRSLSFFETFMDEKKQMVVQSKHSVLYTWTFPMGGRKINFGKDVAIDLKRDDIGEITLSDRSKSYWVSFLDGLQRVLLFTKDEDIVKKLETSASLQTFTRMMEIRIYGIGLSIINNETGVDILYLGIASSGIIWEERKKNKRRYKTMKYYDTAQVESLYQEYLIDRSVGQVKKYYLEGKYELDFSLMTLDKPNSGRNIRRTFYPGVWLSINSSPFQSQIHAKINRIQLDNQLYDCIFPVVLAPTPPPKSVAMSVSFKPIVECSIVQRVVPNSTVKQYKYACVLIQEFHFKVDLPFLTAVLEMFSKEETDDDAAKLFKEDIALIELPLSELVATHSQLEQKNYYDNLHLGPLKIHVSFSMAGSDTSALPGILSTLVQGVGVTLTDVNDVVFRLAFFEREYQFFTQRQLTSEVTAHYTGQGLKQLYVLVLGLDVLGNPYGLVVGLKKGVEDLFYEPFQGAIQGPGEFAEGLCLGMKSLFGHTVGGAAGAVSKITGALGKGLAALTFDDDYQRKRRMAALKKPKTFQEGIARSSKGLVMGFVDGVTGVVRKPVSGAKEEGVEGFFKGLGKGAIGLVARPTAGVVDFASGSLDAVKRAAVTTEDITRLRPPRFIYPDNILRHYCRSEAKGNKLLREIEKGKYASTDSYVDYEEIVPQKEYLLITNHRVLYATKNELFASWSIAWTYLWNEISSVGAKANSLEIVLKAKTKKVLGMFSGNETQRKSLPVSSVARRQKLAQAMESQLKEQESEA